MAKPEEAPMIDFKAVLSRPLLRIEQVAILLDVTPRTVRKHMEEGKLEFKLTPGGRRRVLTESVKKYL